jgi:hypothetical protein
VFQRQQQQQRLKMCKLKHGKKKSLIKASLFQRPSHWLLQIIPAPVKLSEVLLSIDYNYVAKMFDFRGELENYDKYLKPHCILPDYRYDYTPLMFY